MIIKLKKVPYGTFIQTKITKKLATRLLAIAKENKTTRSAVINELLEKAVASDLVERDVAK